jgi:hypothetical protein
MTSRTATLPVSTSQALRPEGLGTGPARMRPPATSGSASPPTDLSRARVVQRAQQDGPHRQPECRSSANLPRVNNHRLAVVTALDEPILLRPLLALWAVSPAGRSSVQNRSERSARLPPRPHISGNMRCRVSTPLAAVREIPPSVDSTRYRSLFVSTPDFGGWIGRGRSSLWRCRRWRRRVGCWVRE